MGGGQVRWALATRSTEEPQGDGPRPWYPRELTSSAPTTGRGEGEMRRQGAGGGRWGSWKSREKALSFAAAVTTRCAFLSLILYFSRSSFSFNWGRWWPGTRELKQSRYYL